MVEFGALNCGAEWVLRIDDDEFPSKKLFSWIDDLLKGRPKYLRYSISRRDLHFVDRKIVYSCWPTRFGEGGNFKLLNPQQRLFCAKEMTYVRQVHTPGFTSPSALGYAPEDVFLIHCNGLLRSASERLEKIRTYAKYDIETAWRVVDESFPEVTARSAHDFQEDGLEEFAQLLSYIPKHNDFSIPELTSNEMSYLCAQSQNWLAARAREMRSIIRDYDEYCASLFIYVPPFLLKCLAEANLSIGRATRSKSLQDRGMLLWRIWERRRKK